MNLPTVAAKPYLLQNVIQNYAWGTSGKDAFIPQLLGITPEKDTPYAELWLGAHVKAPSQVVIGEKHLVALDEWIACYPEKIMGARVVMRFGKQLPFLAKVLSAGSSLSIQAHPDKTQAERLHARDPEHYADDNHKPEIAVALDGLTALMGFKPYVGVLATLDRYPELADFLGEAMLAQLHANANRDLESQTTCVHAMFTTLIQRANSEPEKLAKAVDSLTGRLQDKAQTQAETRFLGLQERYGSTDIGLFAFLLFNYVHLEPGQALYTPAGVPHAYLGGNIIECMANSDNVVRVGLTPKFKDAPTLLDIIDATPQTPHAMAAVPGHRETVYETPAREFELTCWSLPAGDQLEVARRQGPAILLVTTGSVTISWASPTGTKSEQIKQGDSILIPHILSAYTLMAGNVPVQVFKTAVPFT